MPTTSLFGTKVVDGGLGWQSVFAVATGRSVPGDGPLHVAGRLPLQHQPDPRGDDALQRPGARDHHEHAHAGCLVSGDRERHRSRSPGCTASATRSRARSSRSPDSSVRLDAQVDTLWVGVNIKFGGMKRKGPRTRRPGARTTSRRRRTGPIPSCRRYPTRMQSRARRPIRAEVPACHRLASRVPRRPRPRYPE